MIRAILPLAAICVAAILFACAPDPGPFFTPPAIPEDQAAFNHGQLGLLTPDLTKENELIAFRVLSGLKMEAGQSSESNESGAGGPEAWSKARQAITAPPAPTFVNQYRTSRSSTMVFYLNCLDDAFETAAQTLNDRRQHYPSPADVTAWVTAQDQVFADCSADKPVFPEPLAAAAPALARADRDYQIAAAHFYAEDLPEAEQRFRAVASDQASPWRHIGGYMVGRTLLREVSLQKNAAAGPLARQEFSKIANDASAGSLANSARGLLEHLDAIERPSATMESLSKQLLLAQSAPETLADTVRQSAYILRAESFSQALSQQPLPEAFDWVQTLENGKADHAIEKWKSTSSLPWLTLSLMYANGMYANGKGQPSAELIGQADRLSADSPAFATASYNAIRLRMERGETQQPRQQLDKLLAKSSGQPDSLVNAWRAERMRVAVSFDDFLRWAPRVPTGAGEFLPDNVSAESSVLASDSAYILNYRTPLSKLALTAHSKILPAWSASDVALAAWTRAFMLNNLAVTADLAPIVAKAHPDWAASLKPSQANEQEAWKFRTALFIALHHEFQPVVTVDYRKHFEAGSWWCAASPPEGQKDNTISWRLPAIFTPPESVISREEREAAATEIKTLIEKGTAQSFLAPIVFNWAKSHPDDPLVPQALHRLVVVVRYGCGDPSNGKISKTAFDLLHERYPKSEWTAKTPYWFN